MESALAALADPDEQTGARIVAKSLESPLTQIAVNAGFEGGVVVERVRNLEGAVGLNAETGEYEDLIKAGIITKRTRALYANWVDMRELEAEGDEMVGDAIAAEGMDYLLSINSRRRSIADKTAA